MKMFRTMKTIGLAFLSLSAFCCVGGSEVGPMLIGKTSARQSLFVKGSVATMTLEAKGLGAGDRRPLEIVLKDAYGNVVGTIANDGILADADGNWKGEFPLKTDFLGFRRICVSSGELTLPKMGSRPKGCLTYGVFADWNSRSKLDERDCFFGMQGGQYNKWTGAHWRYSVSNPLRDPEKSKAAEQRRRTFEFPVYGTISIEYRFVKPFLSAEARSYFEARRKDVRMNFSFPEGDARGERLYRESIATYVRAARASRPGQRIYELCLECDLTSPDAETTVRCFKVAHGALHEADPEGLLFAAGVSNVRGPALDYMHRLFDLGLAPYMDGFNIHPYTAYPPDRHGFVENIRAFVRLVRARKGADTMMISTEQGYAAPYEEEVMQMEGNVRVALILLGEGFSRHFAFWGYDFGNDYYDWFDGDYGMNYNLELDQKSKRWNGQTSPRPSLSTLSAACLFLDGKRAVTELDGLGETALGYAYADRDEKCVLALWDYGGEPRDVTVKVGREQIDVGDIMGNVTRKTTKDGVLSLSLTGSPCYVLDPDPALWGHNGTMRDIISKEREARRKREEASRRAEVNAIMPTFGDGRMGVKVEVRSRLSTEGVFTVSSRIRGMPEARRSAEITLPAQGSGWVTLLFGAGVSFDPSKTVPVEIAVSQGTNYRMTRAEPVNFLLAPELPDEVGCDWDFSSWCHPQRFRWPVRKDEPSVWMALGWTAKSLLVEVDVCDDVFCNTRTGFQSWRGDSVQLGFAKSALAGTTGNYQTDILERALSEITLALTTNGPSAYRTQTYDPVRFPCDKRGGGEISSDLMPRTINVTTNGSGVMIRYRAAVPWEFLNIRDPHPGLVCRMAAFANDNDGKTAIGKSTRWFELKESVPKGFAYVTLGGPESASATDLGGTPEIREIGQSQRAGTLPITWTECGWCVADKKHNVYLPGGWRVPVNAREAEKCVDAVGGHMFSDGCGTIWSWNKRTGDVVSVLVGESGLLRGKKVFSTWKWENVALFAARPGLKSGFAAKARFGAFIRYRGVIQGFDEDGRDVGVLLDCPKIGITNVVCAAFHPETGELLVGTEWPDRHVHCIGADGREVATGVWPHPSAALAIDAIGTNVYFSGRISERLGTSLHASKRMQFGEFATKTHMLADGGDGWWLATTQGAQHYLKSDPSFCDRRIGGLARVDRVGIRDGKVLVADGERLISFWLDAAPDETPCCTSRTKVEEKTMPDDTPTEENGWRVEYDTDRKSVRVMKVK